MKCSEYADLISDYIDGGLELGEQTKVESHLASCHACRALRDDFLQLVHFSRQLPLHTPSSAVWEGVQTTIVAERSKGFMPSLSNWLNQLRNLRYDLSLPQLATSAAALMILCAVGFFYLNRNQASSSIIPNAFTGSPSALTATLLSNADSEQLAQIERRISELENLVKQRQSYWDAQLRAAFEKNLLYVEQSLIECRQQLTVNPSDPVSQELMLNVYREKVRLLEGFESF